MAERQNGRTAERQNSMRTAERQNSMRTAERHENSRAAERLNGMNFEMFPYRKKYLLLFLRVFIIEDKRFYILFHSYPFRQTTGKR
jgi:hypothetical protein